MEDDNALQTFSEVWPCESLKSFGDLCARMHAHFSYSTAHNHYSTHMLPNLTGTDIERMYEHSQQAKFRLACKHVHKKKSTEAYLEQKPHKNV